MDKTSYGVLSLKKVLQEEGIRGLYRGKLPTYAFSFFQ
jgi:hypothetical protein